MELWLPWRHIAPFDLTWEKSCHHSSSFSISQIAFILADNKDKHKISVKFDFGHNRVRTQELHALDRYKIRP